MSEPTEPKHAESAEMPAESNAPTPATSHPPAQTETAPQDTKQPSVGPNTAPRSTQDSRPGPASSTVMKDQGNAGIQDTSQPPSTSDATTTSAGNSQSAAESSRSGPETSRSKTAFGMPSFDSSSSAVGSSAAPDLSLPAIDTTLPSLDSSLPAIGTDIPSMDMHHTFGDDSHLDHDDPNSGPMDSGSNANQQIESTNGSSHYQAPSNESYNYAQHSAPSQQGSNQQLPQSHSPHQFHSQPQHNYHQSPEYHHTGGFSAVNSNNNHGQQQPQAPVGSAMPPMSSVGQYMTGYPSNAPQAGMDQNSQMRYQLPDDPNKLLSSSRHKKEIKRRTKTGCLTCRKRRIKVRCVLSWCCCSWVSLAGALGLACARGPRHHRFCLPLYPRSSFLEFILFL